MYQRMILFRRVLTREMWEVHAMRQTASIHRIRRRAVVAVATAMAVSATPASAQDTFELSGDPAAVWNLAGVVTVTGGGSGPGSVPLKRKRSGAPYRPSLPRLLGHPAPGRSHGELSAGLLRFPDDDGLCELVLQALPVPVPQDPQKAFHSGEQ